MLLLLFQNGSTPLPAGGRVASGPTYQLLDSSNEERTLLSPAGGHQPPSLQTITLSSPQCANLTREICANNTTQHQRSISRTQARCCFLLAAARRPRTGGNSSHHSHRNSSHNNGSHGSHVTRCRCLSVDENRAESCLCRGPSAVHQTDYSGRKS